MNNEKDETSVIKKNDYIWIVSKVSKKKNVQIIN